MNLSRHNTAEVPVLSRSTYFYRSSCRLLKFRFPDFSLTSFEKLTWNFVYEFVMTKNKSSSSFFILCLFYRRYCPLLKCCLPDFSLQCFWDIQLKFCIWIAFDSIQIIKFKFRDTWATNTGVNVLCNNLVFRTFPKLFSVVFWFTYTAQVYFDLLIQFKFQFCHAWPAFTAFIVIC